MNDIETMLAMRPTRFPATEVLDPAQQVYQTWDESMQVLRVIVPGATVADAEQAAEVAISLAAQLVATDGYDRLPTVVIPPGAIEADIALYADLCSRYEAVSFWVVA